MDIDYDEKVKLLIKDLDTLAEEQMKYLLGIANKELEQKTEVTIDDIVRARNIMLDDPFIKQLQKKRLEVISLQTNIYWVLKDPKDVFVVCS